MDVQDILKSLTNLEQNLQNVESARKQVQETVNAYTATREQLSKLAAEVKVITTELNSIFAGIKDNQTEVSNEISTKVNAIFERINKKVDEIENSAKSIKEEFSKACKSSSSTIEDSVNKSLLILTEGVNETIKGFNGKANAEMDGIIEAMGNYKAFALSMPEQYKNSIEKTETEHKAVLEEVSKKFLTAISTHLSSFENISKGFESILEQYKTQNAELKVAIISKIDNLGVLQKQLGDKITSIDSKIDKSDEKLMENLSSLHDCNLESVKHEYERFDNMEELVVATQEKCEQTQLKVEEAEKAIQNKVSKVNSNCNKSNKMLMFIIIGLLASLLMNFAIILRLCKFI